jgi:hypothetical protein
VTFSLVLTQADRAIDTLIKTLGARGYAVIAPSMRDGAILLDQVREVRDLPNGWTDEQEAASYRVHAHDSRSLFAYAVGPRSPRRFLSTPRRTLWSGRRTADGFANEVGPSDSPQYAFIGVKVCELATGAAPGTVHLWTEGLPTTSVSSAGGSHALGIAYAVALGQALHRVPQRLAVIGIEAGELDTGKALSTDVAAAVDLAVELLARLVVGRVVA